MSRAEIRGGLVLLEGAFVVTFVVLLSVALLQKRDSVASSTMSKVALAALSPPQDASFNNIGDVLNYIETSFYPTYLRFFLDEGSRVSRLPDGTLSMRFNYTALGGLTPMSLVRIRTLRVKDDTSCEHRPQRFDVLPCIPTYQESLTDRDPIRIITTLWSQTVEIFDYLIPESRRYVTGKAQNQQGLPVSYPNEGYVFFPKTTEVIFALYNVTQSRAEAAAQSTVNESTPVHVKAILDALAVSNDDLIDAARFGLADLTSGVEGYRKENNLSAPAEHAVLSKYTRVMFVEFSVLNANMGNPLIGAVTLMFEFTPFGGVKTTFQMQPFQTDFAAKQLESAMLAMLVGWIAAFVAQLVEATIPEGSSEHYEEKDEKRQHRPSVAADVACQLLSGKLAFLVAMLATLSAYVGLLDSIQQEIDTNLNYFLRWKREETNELEFAEFGQLQQLVDNAYLVASIALFLTMFPFVHYLGRFRFFSKHVRLIEVASLMLTSFSAIFIVMIVFYSMLMHLQLAVRVDGFESFKASLLSVFRMLVGDFPFNVSNADNANNPDFSMFLFVFFSILYVWMSLNVFIAILGKAQEVVNNHVEELVDEENVKHFLNFVFRRCRRPRDETDVENLDDIEGAQHDDVRPSLNRELTSILLDEIKTLRKELKQQKTELQHQRQSFDELKEALGRLNTTSLKDEVNSFTEKGESVC